MKRTDLEKFADRVALFVCAQKKHDPTDMDEWYASFRDMYNPVEQFNALYDMGYCIVRRPGTKDEQ